MVVRTIEILLEYISIILCLYKIAKVKIRFNFWLIILFLIEAFLFGLNGMRKVPVQYELIIVLLQFLYTKFYFKNTWKKSITIYGTMLIITMLLQLLCFYICKILLIDIKEIEYSGIWVNIVVCIVIGIWKDKYIRILVNKLNIVKEEVITMIFLLILLRIIYLCGHNETVDFEVAIQFLIETLGVGIASALWLSAENEKEHKKKEIQMYEMYNKAFEETVMTIRIRQHEFENHINAMKSLNYTIKNSEELVVLQEEYCETVLKGNRINKLLSLNINPVVIGFLYSKFTNAEEKGISVEFEIQSINISDSIEIYEFIEIIGILFDNAVEALNDYEDKIIRFKLLLEKENAFSLEIANVSKIYLNEELEMFCMNGYSSKGINRGIGLSRVKEIVINNDAEILIQNSNHKSNNYLSFKIYFNKQ